MKILLTGGGTGGHFYPIIAVAESLKKLATERNLGTLELFYMAPEPYDERLLLENNITFIKSPTGKIRRYFSILNFFDFFKTIFGTVKAVWQIYWLYPDVIFGKGGYVSFPAMFAGWFLRIPVIIHESDSVPGKVNAWAGKFAKRIAISYPEAASFFDSKKVAQTGNPIRRELMNPVKEGGHEYFHLDPSVPVLLFLGGSQGAQIINQTMLDVLPQLVEKYQIIHQAGKTNLQYVTATANAMLLGSKNASRYQVFDSLNSLALRTAAGIADLIISRAGSTIFEIAHWGIPSIIIPIAETHGDHQRKNAYSYAKAGAAVVVEENNLTPHLLQAEINRLMDNEADRMKMKAAAKNFARIDSADLIAQEILNLSREHTK